MDFSFSEDQNELRRNARRFLDVASNEERVREAMATERGYDSKVWEQLSGELGWTALTIPEAHGGLGMSYLDLHPLLEEMGRSLLCSPFFSTVCLGVNTLLVGGSDAQQATHLPGIAEGQTTATLAIAERGGRWDAAGIETTYRETSDGFVLAGEKSFVIDGHTADLLIIAARVSGSDGDEGVALFLVPASTDGVEREWLPTVDQTRKLAAIRLRDVRVPSDALLGDNRDAWPICQEATDLATIALATEQVGAAERCLDMSVEYAKVRQQFGRVIGSFQAIKHKCADMLMRVESARSAAFYASAMASQGSQGVPEAASTAKAYCSDTLFECAAENIQVHGGIGVTWEHPAHLYFKRAKSSESMFGDAAVHRGRIANLIGL